MSDRRLQGAALAAVAFFVSVTSMYAGAAADAERGKALFEKCAACHALDGGEGDGPTLKGVFGRKAGALDTFRYSAAMSRSDVVWNEETLDAFIADPQMFVPRNRMAFVGMPDKADRDDLIAFLKGATKVKE